MLAASTARRLLPAVHVAGDDNADGFHPTRHVPYAIEAAFGQQFVVSSSPTISSRGRLIHAEELEPLVVLVATTTDPRKRLTPTAATVSITRTAGISSTARRPRRPASRLSTVLCWLPRRPLGSRFTALVAAASAPTATTAAAWLIALLASVHLTGILTPLTWCRSASGCFLRSSLRGPRLCRAFCCFALAWPAATAATTASTTRTVGLLIPLSRFRPGLTSGRWRRRLVITEQVLSIVIEATPKLVLPRSVRSHIGLEGRTARCRSLLTLFIQIAAISWQTLGIGG